MPQYVLCQIICFREKCLYLCKRTAALPWLAVEICPKNPSSHREGCAMRERVVVASFDNTSKRELITLEYF